MKDYGLILADRGSSIRFMCQGTLDPRWPNASLLHPVYRGINLTHMDVIELGWAPTPPIDEEPIPDA